LGPHRFTKWEKSGAFQVEGKRKRDLVSAVWALHLPPAKVPGIIRGLEGRAGFKRGLASCRVLQDAPGVVELTWASPAGYQSLFSWCRANMPSHLEWTLEIVEGQTQAFNILGRGVSKYEHWGTWANRLGTDDICHFFIHDIYNVIDLNSRAGDFVSGRGQFGWRTGFQGPGCSGFRRGSHAQGCRWQLRC
jgi:hypothetical protein